MRFTIDDLEAIFNEATENESKYIGIVYYLKSRRRYELEIVEQKDFKKRLGFIKSNFTKELCHRKEEGKEIAKASHGSNLDAIKRTMFELF
ncbi:MAG: hypothetical protein RR486_08250 [Clostridium sp.]|uniref:hypothetical protein n=1 Tax=Clostridium sp. TaxID=1506 RepID=UPI00305A85B5